MHNLRGHAPPRGRRGTPSHLSRGAGGAGGALHGALHVGGAVHSPYGGAVHV